MMWFRCKYYKSTYKSHCDIDEPETYCDGCEYGLKMLKTLDEEYEPDPDEGWEKYKEERWPTT